MMLIRKALRYGLDVFLASCAATIPPALYFLIIFGTAPNGGLMDTLSAILIASLGCLLLLVMPFCFFIAAPLAILIHHFIKLSFARTALLALALTGPAVVYLDYRNYQSSGPDSGPPTEPYSLAHLQQSLSSPTDLILMLVIPTASALLGALTFWYLRFRKDPHTAPQAHILV